MHHLCRCSREEKERVNVSHVAVLVKEMDSNVLVKFAVFSCFASVLGGHWYEDLLPWLSSFRGKKPDSHCAWHIVFFEYSMPFTLPKSFKVGGVPDSLQMNCTSFQISLNLIFGKSDIPTNHVLRLFLEDPEEYHPPFVFWVYPKVFY